MFVVYLGALFGVYFGALMQGIPRSVTLPILGAEVTIVLRLI
jgi:hypothetical protein